MKKILLIFPGYPYKDNTDFIFLKRFAIAISKMGIKPIVIAPYSLSNHLIRKTANKPPKLYEDDDVIIHRPRYISLSNLNFFGISLSNLIANLSILFTASKLDYDLIYSHFYTQLLAGHFLGKNKPFYIGTGESEIKINWLYPRIILNKIFGNLDGIIALSSFNLEDSLRLPLVKNIRTKLIPNAADSDVFYKKNISRKSLYLDDGNFIISYVGNDDKRKNLFSLVDAISLIDNENLLCIMIGKIDQSQFQYDKRIIFLGNLDEELISSYLSVSDIYCHPSIAEGSSNSILEALACGCPVIASNSSFNDDILTKDYSIRINVMSPIEIANSILFLVNSPHLLIEMGLNAIEFSRSNNLNTRVENNLKFMKLID
jgi:glycosyltransferase involved in cell wall biosynthesis